MTKKKLKQILIVLMSLLLSKPKVKKFLVKILDQLPRLKHRLKALSVSGKSVALPNSNKKEISQLSPRATQILHDIKQAMKSE